MRQSWGRLRRACGIALLLAGMIGVIAGAAPVWAAGIAPPVAPPSLVSGSSHTVFVVQVRGTIDLGLAPYIARVLQQAQREGAAAVLVEIDTPGGRLDAVLQMRDTIVGSPLRTIAFVNRTAFSAGALVALAANEIYLAPGAVIGAATPVAGDTGETADEKVMSAVRSTFRSTAELRGRDPRVAEAMVDPALEVAGLVSAGQLLTLTATQAIEWGYGEGLAGTRQEVLGAAGLAGATIQETAPGPAENVVRFLTNPVVASLLISIGMLLIMGDVYSGGIGVMGAAGFAFLAAFFWGHYLAGLAGWEGLALVALGLVLIAVEVFVIPGFGVAGVLGGLSLLGGIFLSLVGRRLVTTDDVTRAAITLGSALLAMIAGMYLLARFAPSSARFSGLILQDRLGELEPARPRRFWRRRAGAAAATVPDEAGPAGAEMIERGEAPAPSGSTIGVAFKGGSGVALSDLRPAGIADIGGERVDVVTRGDYIRAGEPIEVIADEGYRRVVRRVRTPAGSGGTAEAAEAAASDVAGNA